MVYFRGRVPGEVNPIREIQEREITDRITPFFDLVIDEKGGDYAEIIERHRADVALFETKAVIHEKPVLHGVGGNSSIPKVLLIRSDPLCYTRPMLLDMVADYGIDACFAVDSLYERYLEAIRDILYVVPHSIDPAVFRDYGLKKTNTVSYFGHFLPSRPWRIDTARQLRDRFACTFFPHDTARTTAETTRMVYGEAYARQINATRFTPVEGGYCHLITRKFLEAPGARSLLVCPPFPELANYGFVDGETCVTAEPGEIVDKLDALERDEALYAQIVEGGYRLVHTRHRNAHRSQMRDWYEAFRRRQPGQRVVQQGAFGPFELEAQGPSKPFKRERPFDHFLLDEAERAIREHRIEDAEQDAIRAMNLMFARNLAEPRFVLAIVRLLQGKPDQAIYFLTSNFVGLLAPRGATALDPREAAWLALAYLCADRTEKAWSVVGLHAHRRHRELDWVKELLGFPAAGEGAETATLYGQLKSETREDWLALVRPIAEANPASPLGKLLRLGEPAPRKRAKEGAG